MKDIEIDELIAEAMKIDEFAINFKIVGNKYDLARQVIMNRTKSGKTKEELSEGTGLTVKYIEQIEKAQANTTIEDFSKIAHFLDKEVCIMMI